MKKNHLIISIAFTFLMVLSLVPLAFGWFTNTLHLTQKDFSASSIASYFAGGDGSQEHPYQLANARHVYNLAWLNDKGKLEDNSYFVVNNDIDMAGQLNGGAIPPIGTSSRPFTGHFDGQQNTIKNLWVSSNPEDWIEQPMDISDVNVGTDIGMFGKIVKDTGAEGSGVVQMFYVENLEITTNVDSSNVGLICGYLDGAAAGIGMKNGKINVDSVSVASEFSLVGYKTGDVSYADQPGIEPGGDLVINPSIHTDAGSSNGYVAVKNSAHNTAFYTNAITRGTPNPPPSSINQFHVYNGGNINFSGSQNVVNLTTSNCETAKQGNCTSTFFELANGTNITYAYLVPGGNTSFTNVNSGQYPANGVWFDPQNGGTCCVAFDKCNNKGDCLISIYRFKRYTTGANIGKIDTSTLQEIVFNMKKQNGIGNGEVAYFEFNISETEAVEYEYFIGKSGTVAGADKPTEAGLLYLMLAGTDITGGGTAKMKMIKHVDYVEDTISDSRLFDLTDDDYPIHQCTIALSGSTTVAQSFYYNVLPTDATKVHYYTDSTSGVAANVTNYGTGTVAVLDAGTVNFPARETTAP